MIGMHRSGSGIYMIRLQHFLKAHINDISKQLRLPWLLILLHCLFFFSGRFESWGYQCQSILSGCRTPLMGNFGMHTLPGTLETFQEPCQRLDNVCPILLTCFSLFTGVRFAPQFQGPLSLCRSYPYVIHRCLLQ